MTEHNFTVAITPLIGRERELEAVSDLLLIKRSAS